MVKLSDYESFVIKWHLGLFPGQRLGQAFMNEFLPDQADSEVFYEEDPGKANAKIKGKYVTQL